MANDKVYQPGLDEPSVFSGDGEQPVSIHWLAWYIRTNRGASLMVAMIAGNNLIKQLCSEELRSVCTASEPIMFVEVFIHETAFSVPRMEWVIWYANLHKVGYTSANWAGKLKNYITNK